MDKSDGGIAEGTWRDGTGAGSDKRASVGVEEGSWRERVESCTEGKRKVRRPGGTQKVVHTAQGEGRRRELKRWAEKRAKVCTGELKELRREL